MMYIYNLPSHILIYCRSPQAETGSTDATTILNKATEDASPRRNSHSSKSPSPQLSKSKEDEKETEEQRKTRIDKELAELREELLEASASVNLQPLGTDRDHSKYWVFPNLPGLYVERLSHDQLPSSPPDKQTTPTEPPKPHPLDEDKCPTTALTEPTTPWYDKSIQS